MDKAVIDASVLLAFLKDESVSLHTLEAILPSALISSVNTCEVATVLGRLGMPYEKITTLIHETVGRIVSFNQEQSLVAAKLWKLTRPYGLSLGDRACLALGFIEKLPIYTADKTWEQLPLKDAEIRMIR